MVLGSLSRVSIPVVVDEPSGVALSRVGVQPGRVRSQSLLSWMSPRAGKIPGRAPRGGGVSIPVVVDEPSGAPAAEAIFRQLCLSQSLLSWMSPRAGRRGHHVDGAARGSQSLLSWMSPRARAHSSDGAHLDAVSIPVVVDEPSGGGSMVTVDVPAKLSQSLLSWMSPRARPGRRRGLPQLVGLNPCCRG